MSYNTSFLDLDDKGLVIEKSAKIKEQVGKSNSGASCHCWLVTAPHSVVGRQRPDVYKSAKTQLWTGKNSSDGLQPDHWGRSRRWLGIACTHSTVKMLRGGEKMRIGV